MTNEILELLRYAFNAENPILSIAIVLVVAFVLFIAARRFFTTDYIKENRESRDQLKQLNDALSKEYDRLKKENEELKQTLKNID